MAIRIALVGCGKIELDQHVPTIATSTRFQLVAVADPLRDPRLGVPHFTSTAEMYSSFNGKLDAVAICTPPLARHAAAIEALHAGCHVLLEKPPAATLGAIDDLMDVARRCRRALYAAWHSQHADAVEKTRSLLAGADVTFLNITWKEDVRKWHPDQEWIWGAGGFGVFDPGINALSIVSRVLPQRLVLQEANLVLPSNRQAPIAASLRFAGGPLNAHFDWRSTEDTWTVEFGTSRAQLIQLRQGGSELLIDGAPYEVERVGEYPSLYNRFADLVNTCSVEVDREPLRIVADAFLLGTREEDVAFL